MAFRCTPMSLLFCTGKAKLPVCVDQNKDCPYWAFAGDCKKYTRYMLMNCKYSCNLCGGKCSLQYTHFWWESDKLLYIRVFLGAILDSQNVPGWPLFFPPQKNSLHGAGEERPWERGWAERSFSLAPTLYCFPNARPQYNMSQCETFQCSVYREVFLFFVSGEDAQCQDQDEKCSFLARKGECLTNAPYMFVKCRKSCFMCGGRSAGCAYDARFWFCI